jgi:hypothetical protein
VTVSLLLRIFIVAVIITLFHTMVLLVLSTSPGIEAAYYDLARLDTDRRPSIVKKGYWLLAATVTTALHIAASPMTFGVRGFESAYHALAKWDTTWYASIVDKGYSLAMTDGREMNVAFFPGYPVLAFLFKKLLSLDTKTALLVASQSACVGFWMYFLLLLRSWKVTRPHAMTGVFVVASFPSAFYLVAGYSESLFLCGLLGMMWWWNRFPPRLRLLSGVHGFIMSSTRLVGLPLCAYPIISSLLEWKGGRKTQVPWIPSFLTSCLAALGTTCFYLYLQVRFGNWDLYAIANLQGHGWRTQPEYLAFMDWRRLVLPSLPRLDAPPEDFGRLLTALMLWSLAALLIAEWFCRTRQGWREQRSVRLGLYFSAAVMLYVYVAATHSTHFAACLRFMLTVQVMLTLALLHLQVRLGFRTQQLIRAALLLYGVIGALFQGIFAYRFMHEIWVA